MGHPLVKKLDQTGDWGWVIYRTVYSPQSDQHWEQVLRRLDELIRFDFDDFNFAGDPGDCAVAWDKYRNVIFQDRERFQGASLESLKQHFGEWAPTNQTYHSNHSYSATWRAFLVIDDAAVNTILSLPTASAKELRQNGGHRANYSITAVAQFEEQEYYWYDEDTGEEHFSSEPQEGDSRGTEPPWPGHFQVSLYSLHTFWCELTGWEKDMERLVFHFFGLFVCHPL